MECRINIIITRVAYQHRALIYLDSAIAEPYI